MIFASTESDDAIEAVKRAQQLSLQGFNAFIVEDDSCLQCVLYPSVGVLRVIDIHRAVTHA